MGWCGQHGPRFRSLALASCPELSCSLLSPDRSARAPPLHPRLTWPDSGTLGVPICSLAALSPRTPQSRLRREKGPCVCGEKLSVTLLPPALSEPVSAPVCIGANTIPLPPPPPFLTGCLQVFWSAFTPIPAHGFLFLVKLWFFHPSLISPPIHSTSASLYLLVIL